MALAQILSACTPEEPERPETYGCTEMEAPRIEFGELLGLYRGMPTELLTDGYLEGVVISSDGEGNIFGSIYLQDRAQDPRYGVALKTDLVGSGALYPPGTRVRLFLDGLYLGKQDFGYAIGTVREVFGNPVLDRLPALATSQRLIPGCTDPVPVSPRAVYADGLDSTLVHTLVRIEDVEVAAEYKGKTYAEEGVETLVPLSGCTGTPLGLVNSGYADFRDQLLPGGSGAATGILLGKAPDYHLLLRYASDLEMTSPPCTERYPPVSSQHLLISEIADPDNEPGARFIEIYNSGESAIDLKGWSLLRYTNANTEPGRPADLSGMRIEPGSTLVFSADPDTFLATYGMSPDAVLPPNGPADSNGDDTLLLMDPFGEVVDIFGVPGEDGTGTTHEFEDGGAIRRPGVLKANPIFDPSEWLIYNDSGGNGTENQPKSAPGDFSPGSHPAGA
ncbi:DUF5689 domain-containing protein [Robiginitalea sp. SC105]|uniref:DUF5689 domain-containing protein n=1 Tax=Robiginitalea sp. SC105 TaxID=2762332 RepID=UPI00163A00E0|nr:DUF5689 domain-containing protein [Robiginitalea sp. SC105]MBC2837998.1 lamin tail domain-containing protein [Robiginitalea sp. SC105]